MIRYREQEVTEKQLEDIIRKVVSLGGVLRERKKRRGGRSS